MTDTELLQAIEDQQLMVNVNTAGVMVCRADGRQERSNDLRGALWPFAVEANELSRETTNQKEA